MLCWNCLYMWGREQWGKVGCSQSMFQRNSSLEDVNRTQPFAWALHELFWLSELIPIPSCKIHKTKKNCLVCFSSLRWCSDSFTNFLSVSAGLHHFYPACPQPSKVIVLSSAISWAGELCFRCKLKNYFQLVMAGHMLALLSFIRKTIWQRAL